jgi:hypothetical protein
MTTTTLPTPSDHRMSPRSQSAASGTSLSRVRPASRFRRRVRALLDVARDRDLNPSSPRPEPPSSVYGNPDQAMLLLRSR